MTTDKGFAVHTVALYERCCDYTDNDRGGLIKQVNGVVHVCVHCVALTYSVLFEQSPFWFRELVHEQQGLCSQPPCVNLRNRV